MFLKLSYLLELIYSKNRFSAAKLFFFKPKLYCTFHLVKIWNSDFINSCLKFSVYCAYWKFNRVNCFIALRVSPRLNSCFSYSEISSFSLSVTTLVTVYISSSFYRSLVPLFDSQSLLSYFIYSAIVVTISNKSSSSFDHKLQISVSVQIFASPSPLSSLL